MLPYGLTNFEIENNSLNLIMFYKSWWVRIKRNSLHNYGTEHIQKKKVHRKQKYHNKYL